VRLSLVVNTLVLLYHAKTHKVVLLTPLVAPTMDTVPMALEFVLLRELGPLVLSPTHLVGLLLVEVSGTMAYRVQLLDLHLQGLPEKLGDHMELECMAHDPQTSLLKAPLNLPALAVASDWAANKLLKSIEHLVFLWREKTCWKDKTSF
jgi:hypothetical protein